MYTVRVYVNTTSIHSAIYPLASLIWVAHTSKATQRLPSSQCAYKEEHPDVREPLPNRIVDDCMVGGMVGDMVGGMVGGVVGGMVGSSIRSS